MLARKGVTVISDNPSSHTSPTKHHSSAHHSSSDRTTRKTTSKSTHRGSANPDPTEFAVFTANGKAYTVTSHDGSEVIDGKTLKAGGATQTIAGDKIAEASNGAVLVNGSKIKFASGSSSKSKSKASTSRSHSSSASASASASASNSASRSASASSSRKPATATGNTAPTKAVGAGAAILGAVVGVLVL